jgi:hypothetical protein
MSSNLSIIAVSRLVMLNKGIAWFVVVRLAGRHSKVLKVSFKKYHFKGVFFRNGNARESPDSACLCRTTPSSFLTYQGISSMIGLGSLSGPSITGA